MTEKSSTTPQENPLHDIEFEDLFTNTDLYFCGKPIKQVFENQFFDCLNIHVDCGFCYGLSGLAMLMLKDDPTAQIVQGMARSPLSKKRLCHCWVEIQRDGEWYVVDLGWSFMLKRRVTPREQYYDPSSIAAESQWTLKHREFWRLYLPNILFKKCSRWRTSWLLPQFIWCFSPPTDPGYGFVGCHDEEFLKHLRDPRLGRAMTPQAFRFNGVIVDQHIVKELLQPGLMEASPLAKDKAERHYQRYCRKLHVKDVHL